MNTSKKPSKQTAQENLKSIHAFMDLPENKEYFEKEEAKLAQMVLIQRLKEIRKQKGLTQIELSKLMGVKQPEIAKWEAGEVSPSLGNILKFCSAINGRLEIIY